MVELCQISSISLQADYIRLQYTSGFKVLYTSLAQLMRRISSRKSRSLRSVKLKARPLAKSGVSMPLMKSFTLTPL